MIPRIKKILYATDLSDNSAYVFRYALDSARQHHADLVILHVMEAIDATARNLMMAYVGKDFLEEKDEARTVYAKDRIKKRLDLFFDMTRDEAPELVATNISIDICEGYPAEEILKKADELNCDAIVMGTHGKGILRQTFLGSVAKKVLRRTRKPVFVVPLPK